MLQIFYNKIQGSNLPKINNDTFADKVIHRLLSNVLLLALLHSLYVVYHGQAIICGESYASSEQEYINAMCWSLGLHVYENHTEAVSSLTDESTIVHQDLFPGLTGKAEREESKIHLWKISMIPAFIGFLLSLCLSGRVCWSFLQKNMLTELIGTLDTRKSTIGRNVIPKQEDRDAQLNESYETLMGNLRFYTTYASHFVGCMFLNLITLITQSYWIISFIGNGDTNFAFNVYDNLDKEYKEMPVKMLYIFPSIALCHYEKIQPAGSRLPIDYICSLKWNMSFLRFFAFLWFLEMICVVIAAFALVYWVLFVTCRKFREIIVRRALQLDSGSEVWQGVQRLNGGTLFIVMQLNNNVRADVVCRILRKVSNETPQNFQNYELGL